MEQNTLQDLMNKTTIDFDGQIFPQPPSILPTASNEGPMSRLGTSSTFITVHLSQGHTLALLNQASATRAESIYFSEHKPNGRKFIAARTQDVWDASKVRSRAVKRTAEEKDSFRSMTRTGEANWTKYRKGSAVARVKFAGGGVANQIRKQPRATLLAEPASIRSILKPRSQRVKGSTRRCKVPVKVTLNVCPTVHELSDHTSSDEITSSGSELDLDDETGDKENTMAQSKKPALKLRLSTGGPPSISNATAQSPAPPSAVRTPSIKLSFKPKAGSPETPQVLKLKQPESKGSPSSGKKRKRQPGDEAEGAPVRKQTHPKIKLKTPSTARTPATPAPIFKLKTKGKIPKRAPGSGYDSELEEREQDPTILDGFVIRMPPGPDSDYVRTAIQNGTIGVHRAQGGADIRMRFLDQAGRRGIIIVNGNQYATTLVDLPCIIEGMKSWDKKGWIKSIDISQMLLVLGPCKTDEEARSYRLPADVDPKTYAYAHGLTAPMKWVRKRRFARTRRARVDDIESIERKVNQLLEADDKSLGSAYQVLDHDPRSQRDQYSPEYDSDDAEAEDDDGYFGLQNGQTAGIAETPAPIEQQELDEDEVDEYERLFAADVEEPSTNGHAHTFNGGPGNGANGSGETSIAIESASASPAPFASVVGTPAPEQSSDQPQTSDDDESDADDDSAADDDDKDEDADDNLQQVKDRIADMEAKIAEQTAQLRHQKNQILRKKLAGKIQALRDDVDMMRKQHGLDVDGDGDDGGS